MKQNAWTESEDSFLIEHHGIISTKEISIKLDRKISSVNTRINRLKIAKRHFIKYSNEEDLFIIENKGKLSAKQIGQHLGRSPHSIDCRIEYLGLTDHRGPITLYSDYENNFVLNNYKNMTCQEMSKILGRSIDSLRQKIKLLKKNPINKLRKKAPDWTNEEIVFLKESVEKLIPYIDISESLGRALNSVYNMASKLGFKVIRKKYDKRLRNIWRAMKYRCYSENNNRYKNYALRGISICDEWLIWENFETWSLTNGYKKTLSIDRIDNNGNYCPENCKWSTPQEQAQNTTRTIRLTIYGETKTVKEWILDPRCEIKYGCLMYRIRSGRFTPDRILKKVRVKN